MILHDKLQDGYCVFESVIPVELIAPCYPEISKEGFYVWDSVLAEEFGAWITSFLQERGIDTYEVSGLETFNRVNNIGMQWHLDSYGNPKGEGRVFIACYITPTTNGRGALKILPGSHLGKYSGFAERLLKLKDLFNEGRKISEFPEAVEIREDELLLPVPARSIVVCDERMIHAVEVNTSQEMRIMVLQWAWIKQKEKENDAC